MKKFLAAFAVLALLTAGTAFADDKKAEPTKAAACCSPKCELKDGKCVTKEAGKCTKDCAQPCCKPKAKSEHPQGDHPK